MDSQAFLQQLQQTLQAELSRLDALPLAPPGQAPPAAIIELLKLALKSEIEASEIAASWMLSTPEMDLKLGLARQCGDEARHFYLIQQRLQELGFPAQEYNPIAHGYSPLFRYLRTLHGTVERLAAAQFAREGIAHKMNGRFISFLEQAGDARTAEMYRTIVQPEEAGHHEFAIRMLAKYANTPEAQARARAAMRRSLELADEFLQLAGTALGSAPIPAS